MRICERCVLPETFPGINFDERGWCSYCVRDGNGNHREDLKDRYHKRFSTVLTDTKGSGPYDALMAYSGGKDSTYVLRLLRERYGLRVLAVTFDHGFVSPMARKNIWSVTEALDIDQLTVRPGFETLRTVFRKSIEGDIYPPKALERASSICHSCMNLVKSFLLKTAIEMTIPMVAFGWSPGQAPIHSSVLKMNRAMLRQTQKVISAPLKMMIGERLSAFFLEERHYQVDSIPYFVHPLAFADYNEHEILTSITSLGWVNPKDTDSNSTNCLLNGFANECHLRKYGYHPYAYEIAGLVRGGYMTRAEGLCKLSTPADAATSEYVKRKLEATEN